MPLPPAHVAVCERLNRGSGSPTNHIISTRPIPTTKRDALLLMDERGSVCVPGLLAFEGEGINMMPPWPRVCTSLAGFEREEIKMLQIVFKARKLFLFNRKARS